MPKKETTTRAVVLSGFRDYCRSQRLDGEALLESVGLDPTAPSALTDTIPLNAFAQLLHNAAEAPKDPCFGLGFANYFPPGGTGLVGPMLVHAGTIREALVAFTQFIALVVHPIDISYEENQMGEAVVAWSYDANFTAPRQQYISLSAAMPIIRLRTSCGENWLPASADFGFDELPCRERAMAQFGANLRYNRPRNCIVVPASVLSLPLKSADPRLQATLKHFAEADLRESIEPTDVVARVSKIVRESLGTQPVTLERTAQALEMTPRAIQWQLSQSATTFEKILNEARRTKAGPLLTNTGMPLGQIAEAVGFSELSSFSRAASNWFGMSPRAYRLKHRETKSRTAKPKPSSDGDI